MTPADPATTAETRRRPAKSRAAIAALGITRMSLQELKATSPADLLALAEKLEIENANSMRKQDMMFAILKTLAEEGVEISGGGTMEVLQDGFGFLRARKPTTCPAPTTSMSAPRRSAATACAPATASTAPSARRAKASATSPWSPSPRSTSSRRTNVRHKVHFDNLTPLYPESA
jgi:transcription termination factor Rho